MVLTQGLHLPNRHPYTYATLQNCKYTYYIYILNLASKLIILNIIQPYRLPPLTISSFQLPNQAPMDKFFQFSPFAQAIYLTQSHHIHFLTKGCTTFNHTISVNIHNHYSFTHLLQLREHPVAA